MSSLGYVNLELALRRALGLDESVEISPESVLKDLVSKDFKIDYGDLLDIFKEAGVCSIKLQPCINQGGLTWRGINTISENYPVEDDKKDSDKKNVPRDYRNLKVRDLVLIAQSASAESCSVQYAT